MFVGYVYTIRDVRFKTTISNGSGAKLSEQKMPG